MAGVIHCDECGQEAEVMVTRLDGSGAPAYCMEDFALLCLGVAINSIPAQAILEAVGPVHVAQREAAKAEAGEKPRKRSRAKAEAEVEAPAEGADGGPAQVEAAASDG